MYKTVLTTLEHGIFTVTLNRPDKMNALNRDVMADLNAVLEEIESNAEIRATILTGAGQKAFVAGADISEFVGLTDAEGKALAKTGQDIFSRIENCTKPVVAAVNGFALGGGFELVLVADIVVAVESARFGLPEVKLGLLPGGGGTQRLSRLVGRNKAKELIMTGKFFDANEARSLGIVNQVVADNELLPLTFNLADQIIKRAPLAVRMAKQLVNDGLNASLATAITQEMGFTATLYATEDAQEGISAFLEKRPPVFKGL